MRLRYGGVRASQYHRFGPFRVRTSEPLAGSGKPYFTVSIHVPILGSVRLFERVG
jgi:hypothetical protein